METKKKLRRDIDYLLNTVADLKMQISKTNEVLFMHQCTIDNMQKKADVISGRECAHMLGWKSDSIKSEYLKKLGIEFTLDENGHQKISRQSVVAYLAKKEDKAE